MRRQGFSRILSCAAYRPHSLLRFLRCGCQGSRRVTEENEKLSQFQKTTLPQHKICSSSQFPYLTLDGCPSSPCHSLNHFSTGLPSRIGNLCQTFSFPILLHFPTPATPNQPSKDGNTAHLFFSILLASSPVICSLIPIS